MGEERRNTAGGGKLSNYDVPEDHRTLHSIALKKTHNVISIEKEELIQYYSIPVGVSS